MSWEIDQRRRARLRRMWNMRVKGCVRGREGSYVLCMSIGFGQGH